MPSFDINGLLPTWADVNTHIPQTDKAVDYYTNTLEDLRSAGESYVGELVSGLGKSAAASVFGSIASAAEPLSGFAGPLVALGGSVFGSIFKGLFSGSPPPPEPNIAGEEVNSFIAEPLKTPERAIIAAKVLNGQIKSKVVTEQTLINQLASSFRVPCTDGRSMNRAQQYFAGTCGYKTLFDNPQVTGQVACRNRLGAMIAWSAPRLRLRSLLVEWCLYKQAMQWFSIAIGQNCNSTQAYGFGQNADTLNLEAERRACIASSPMERVTRLCSLLLPDAYLAADNKTWIYSRWDSNAVRADLENHYTGPIIEYANDYRWVLRPPGGGSWSNEVLAIKQFLNSDFEIKGKKVSTEWNEWQAAVRQNVEAMTAARRLQSATNVFMSRRPALQGAMQKKQYQYSRSSIDKTTSQQKAATARLLGTFTLNQKIGLVVAGAATVGVAVWASRRKKKKKR